MIVRIIHWSAEAVVSVQEFEAAPNTKLVVFETMSDVRVRSLKEYEPAPPIPVEEPYP